MGKKWSKEELIFEALKYSQNKDFVKNSSGAYQAAKRSGILKIIRSHMIKPHPLKGKNHPNFMYTNEYLAEVASKYIKKEDFLKYDKKIYNAASARGILKQICKHTIRKKISRENHSQFKWTIEKIQEEAYKYTKRDEFKKSSGGAWSAAQNLGILDEVCNHMILGNNSSKSEISLFNIIKAIYPKTQKLIDKKAKIVGKPYIRGFELDIYIPELRKGIEFDGRYYHSFSGLKRARPSWSDDDIINYHQLKDSYFLSKNIKVIHVKEEDWIKNKQACIDKCLEFLDNKL